MKQSHQNRQRSTQSFSITDRELLIDLLSYVSIRTHNPDLLLLQEKSTIQIIASLKQVFDGIVAKQREAETEINEIRTAEQNNYEHSLQKLEAEVRSHIRVQQQLKLYIENNQTKVEELEKQLSYFKKLAVKGIRSTKENYSHHSNTVKTEAESQPSSSQQPQSQSQKAQVMRPNSQQQYNSRQQLNYYQPRSTHDNLLYSLLNKSIQ